jgi:hypothetical protein
VDITHVGRLFATVISFLQSVSRFRILRPGLRRWAEISLFSPALAAFMPVLIISCGGVLAVLRTEGIISSAVTMVGLFALSVLAPVFSIFIVLGWCLGRMLSDSGSFVVSVSESVALLPLVLFLPMMQRNLVGPRTRSRQWEFILALLLAPCVAALAYRNWIIHFYDFTGSLGNKLVSSIELVRPLDVNVGARVLGTGSELEAVVIGIVMAALVMLIAIVAVQCSDADGNPELMFGRFVKKRNPVQILRRQYIDLAEVELGEPSRWGRWSRYGFSGILSTFVLSEVLGMRSIILVLVFLVAVAFTRRFPRATKKREIHPIVKTVPIAAFGLFLGAVAVSPSRVFIAFAIVAILAGCASLVRTRTLWDS